MYNGVSELRLTMKPTGGHGRTKLSASAKPSPVRNNRSIASLRRERAWLEEEVRQLRAAVKVYAELARRAAERHARNETAARRGRKTAN
jgi:hypothetical protein